MAPTIKEVAELAGVSTSAVSRSFTAGASISLETREKVERAARILGYVPSLIARSLTTNRTKLIGLVANNFQNPVFLEVFDLYTQALQERGLRPLLVNLSTVTDPSDSLGMLRQYSVDGVIIATSTLPPIFAEAFRDAGMPVVHTFGRHAKRPKVHVVGIDNIACGKLAAETLLAHGYRRIGFLGGPQSATSTQDRAEGFARKLQAAGVKIGTIRYASAYAYDAGRAEMASMLEDRSLEAVFCGDDLICMGAMDAARGLGLRIPDDIGFLGFNDMTMSRWSAYDLSTIRQPIGSIIRESVNLVVSLVDDPGRTPLSKIFPCTVIERKTLRPKN